MAEDKKCPEEGEFVLCTVTEVSKTSAFVKLDDYGIIGVLATSEISPGRIRNIRDFIVPNKKIVCKVLRVDMERRHVDLSLRRVGLKEKKEVLENYKKEKDAHSILTRIIDKSRIDDVIGSIKSEFKSLAEFLSSAKENPELFKKFGLEEETEKLMSLIKERTKIKKIVVKARLEVRTSLENDHSITSLKKALDVKKLGAKLTYISAPNYILTVESNDYKKANKILGEAISEIEEKIKKMGWSMNVKTE